MKTRPAAPGRSITLLLAALAGVSGAAHAESLEDAWQMALGHDQSLAAAGSDLDAAKASERAARDARWPSVAANAGYTRLNASPTLDVATPSFLFQSGPIFRDNQIVSGSVQMKLPLYAGGQIVAGIDAAHHAVTGASEFESATVAELKLDVAEAYVGVLRARRALQAAASSVDSLAAHVADVQKLVEAQSVASSDLLAARVALANAEIGKLRPQLALTGGYMHFDNQILDRQDFSMIGVGFSWNLFDGGQSRNRADALSSASRAQKSRLEDLRSQIELDVRQSWLGVQEAQARMKASGEAVTQAQENLRISRQLYDTGLATNTQVLDAVTLQINAVNNRDNAVLDVSLSLLRLAHAVGAL